ncbi:MAG: CapA family protein [Nitrospirae bacterium]|nr:CapA family protein [Nitrospirota bacterium]
MNTTSSLRKILLSLIIAVAFAVYPSCACAGEFTLLAVGDVLPHAPWQVFEPQVSGLMKCAAPLFFTADVVVGNLESPLTGRAAATSGGRTAAAPMAAPNGKLYRTESPDAAQALRDAGFTVLTLAGDHMMDYGPDGLLDTLGALKKAGIVTAGAGADAAEAYRPGVVDVKGMESVFLSASDAAPKACAAEAGRPGIASMKDEAAFIKVVKEARSKRPEALIVLGLHWGVEASHAPTARQKALARKLVDAGADLILGHHAHRLQGLEVYKGRPVFYSLGSFLFDTGKPGGLTVAARLTYADGKREPSGITLIPVEIGQAGAPRPLDAGEAGYAKALDDLRGLVRPFGLMLDGDSVVPLPPPAEDEIPEDFEGI